MAALDEISQLRNHVEELENRLERYHQAFQEAAEQRDRLALDAAWGVLTSFSGIVAFAGFFLIADRFFGLSGWLLAIVAGVAGSVVQAFASRYVDRWRFQDIEKFERFPEWESKASDLWEIY